jgi:hypothetical protein
MPERSPRVRSIAKAVGAIVALALFASSLTSILALDGKLKGAVSAERRPASVPVSDDGRSDGDCPWRDRREQGPRYRS